ncbi:MAG: mismatch-specific DNA-glycosylase [Gammaproteobacteria bacterium]|nr:mismatch-specific DNA-glycosylase [Gammaproteobacteria bacterium]
MRTLPDFLAPGLDIISVGLNPSPRAVREGFYFPNPRNRFWRALNVSALPAAALVPGPAAMATLLERDRIGCTDVVKRPTRRGAELRAADFDRWVPRLAARLTALEPRIVWFHGRVAWTRYCQCLGVDPGAAWGLQAVSLPPDLVVFVTPNPSPANAAFSLAEISAWYARLASLRAALEPRAPAQVS